MNQNWLRKKKGEMGSGIPFLSTKSNFFFLDLVNFLLTMSTSHILFYTMIIQ